MEKIDFKDFQKVESVLNEFNRLGYYVQKKWVKRNDAFDLWFDVLARFSVLLPNLIKRERDRKGEVFMEKLMWLLEMNFKYIKKYRVSKDIKLEVKEIIYLITHENIQVGLKKIR